MFNTIVLKNRLYINRLNYIIALSLPYLFLCCTFNKKFPPNHVKQIKMLHFKLFTLYDFSKTEGKYDIGCIEASYKTAQR